MIINLPSVMPVSWLWENLYNASLSPSTIHASGTKVAEYYARRLFQKALSPFKFTIPEEWPRNFFLYTLYGYGVNAVFDGGKFGVLCQPCNLSGYNINYLPTTAIIANPVLKDTYPGRKWELEIGSDCELLHIQPDYHGIMDIVTFYADQLALFAENIAVNLVNSKVAFVFGAGNKVKAESMKKVFDDISSGNPAAFVDTNLFDSQGNLSMELFNRDVKASYIVSDLLEDMRKVEERFLTEIGIANANTDKRERLITDEVNANNDETKSACEIWLETLQDCCKKINSMFPEVGIKVEWRVPPVREEGGAANVDRSDEPSGTV